MAESLEHEWRTFELYEKIRLRERRKRFLVLFVGAVLFLSLCAVPVVQERTLKWQSLRAAQHISVELEKLKTLAITQKKPARLSFVENGEVKIEVIDHCTDGPSASEGVRKKWPDAQGELRIMKTAEAKDFGVALAVDQICFDPVFGLENLKSKEVIIVVPVKDLSDHRLDRASYVVLESESAKISIN